MNGGLVRLTSAWLTSACLYASGENHLAEGQECSASAASFGTAMIKSNCEEHNHKLNLIKLGLDDVEWLATKTPLCSMGSKKPSSV